jgi:hypothetical protein
VCTVYTFDELQNDFSVMFPSANHKYIGKNKCAGQQISLLMQSVFPSATILTTTARAVHFHIKLFKLYQFTG